MFIADILPSEYAKWLIIGIYAVFFLVLAAIIWGIFICWKKRKQGRTQVQSDKEAQLAEVKNATPPGLH
jgi:protein-S-isoprenylcysteine O-methyltransferase Ste14